ncbi:MAG: uridine kinase [Nanoarchaeota archaeon]
MANQFFDNPLGPPIEDRILIAFKEKESDKHGVKICSDLKTGLWLVKSRISELNKLQDVIIIGIGGGSSSGKTYFSKKLKEKIISMDDYYKGIDLMKDLNFDDPNTLDLDFLREHLDLLKNGVAIKKPIYDFKTHLRKGYEKFEPNPVIIVDGLFALSDAIKDVLDIKVFIDSQSEKRLERRIKRDMKERGRSYESIIKQWEETVEPMYKRCVLPTRNYADIIILN